MIVMGVSAFLGSLSFLTVFNLRQPRRRWTLDTRLVVTGMGMLLVVGMAFFLIADWSRMFADPEHRFKTGQSSLFLSVNRTTGMTTSHLSQASDDTSLAMIILMFIGGASTSTASGIKIGSFMVVMFGVISALIGSARVVAFGREIPASVVLRANALVLIALGGYVFGLFFFIAVDPKHRHPAGRVRCDVGAGQLRLDPGCVAAGDANRGQYPDHDDVRWPAGTAGDHQPDTRSTT